MGSGRAISWVAAATVLSRVLGLARDILIFAALGVGSVSSAFLLAFTVPNLFRRMLGEGALSSATIPVMSKALVEHGPSAALEILRAVIWWLLKVTLLLIVVIYLAALGILFLPGMPERWYMAAEYSYWLMPYVSLICIAAILCGGLNVFGRFTVAAFNGVWLNIAMIAAGGLAVGLLGEGDYAVAARILCVGVVLGGVIQFVVPLRALGSNGLVPSLRGTDRRLMRGILPLFIPAVFGATAMQINTLVSRFLAFLVDAEATGQLYLAARLIELPLGVFAISVSTVFFPQLAAASGAEQAQRFNTLAGRGIVLILLITLPATVGLWLMAERVIDLLFRWQSYGTEDVWAAVPVLRAAVLGLPLFGLSGFLIRIYHARQRMREPARYAWWVLLVNLVFSLALMQRYGAVGLALAGVIAAAAHTALLWKNMATPCMDGRRWWDIAKICMASALMGMALAWAEGQLAGPEAMGKVLGGALCLGLIAAGAAFYLGLIVVMGLGGGLAALRSRRVG